MKSLPKDLKDKLLELAEREELNPEHIFQDIVDRLTSINITEIYEEILDSGGIGNEIKIGYATYNYSYVYSKVDPVSFEQDVNNYAASQEEEGFFLLIDNEYYDREHFEYELENF